MWIYNLFPIFDLFPNRTSDTCKIQSSRLNRIVWSHRWWKVVPSQKFVNIIIRNSRNIQLYQVLQILLAMSSGWMGVSCLPDPLFDSWLFRCVKIPYMHLLPMILSKILKTWGRVQNWRFSEFPKIELKIWSIRTIRKKSLIRIIQIFGKRMGVFRF